MVEHDLTSGGWAQWPELPEGRCHLTMNAFLRSSVMEFRLADFFYEKIIVGPLGVPDPPSLAQMTFTQ